MSWNTEALRLKKIAAKPPKDCQTIEQIAKLLDCSEDAAADTVRMLIKDGRAVMVRGRKINVAGALVAATYYKLVK